jgi:cytochrome c oxidase subunit 4
MSEHEHSAHAHAEGDVHVHVHSWKMYLGILLALLFLTIVTVAASYLDIDGLLALGGEVQGVGAWNLTVAVLIATVKATLVVLFFMHLKDDARFNGLIFVGALLFIGVFFAYTMNDTAVRGTMDRYNGVHVDPDNGESAPGGIDAIEGERPRDARETAEEPQAAHGGAHAAPSHQPPADETPVPAEVPAEEPVPAEAVPAEGEAMPTEGEAPVEGEAAPAEAPEAPAEAPEAAAPAEAPAPAAEAAAPAEAPAPRPRRVRRPAAEQPAEAAPEATE